MRKISLAEGIPTAHIPVQARSRTSRLGPIATLLLAAPIIAEVLYGATRISTIFVLIPEILTWGCGALLIREWVRRWGKGWGSMLLMGLALAVAEEWVIQQTSIAPFAAGQGYGRVWGVNWVYLLWALGYESVWVVLIPVQFTELLFPARREALWLRTRGMVVASVAFLMGACMAWYGWTQRARVQVFHMPRYSPPPLYLSIGVGLIGLLVLCAYALPSRRWRADDAAWHTVPRAWFAGLILSALGAVWAASVFVGWGKGSLPGVPYKLVLVGGVAWAALAFFLVRRWTASPDWGDAHRFAVVFGGVVACMAGGFVVFKVGGALRVDWIGKGISDGVALVWLLALERLRRTTP